MKVRLTDIPEEGLNINNTISLSALNDRMNEGPDNDIIFLSEPRAILVLNPKRGGVELKGTICSTYRQPCARCLEDTEHRISREVDVFLKPSSDEDSDHSRTEKDDIGIQYFSGEHLDLEDLLQETLILGLSPYNSEHKNCPGSEYISQEEDSQKSTLKDLLKRAGLN